MDTITFFPGKIVRLKDFATDYFHDDPLDWSERETERDFRQPEEKGGRREEGGERGENLPLHSWYHLSVN